MRNQSSGAGFMKKEQNSAEQTAPTRDMLMGSKMERGKDEMLEILMGLTLEISLESVLEILMELERERRSEKELELHSVNRWVALMVRRRE